MTIYTVLGEMLTLFLIMAVGYGAYKSNCLTKAGNKVLAKLIVNITLPALILASVMQIEEKIGGFDLFMLLASSFLAYALLGLVAYVSPIILRVAAESRGIYGFMAIFGNVAFVGFPVLAALYGKEAIFYAALFNIPFNLLIYSLGKLMISAHEKIGFSKGLLLNPPLLASIVALILYLLPLRFPVPIIETVDLLGSITIPGAMLLVGAALGAVPLKEVFTEVKVYFVSLIKLLFCPLLILVIFRLFITNPLILGVAVITTAMPVATNTAMLAMEYGGDETLASKGIFISTILSLFTIPLIILLLF